MADEKAKVRNIQPNSCFITLLVGFTITVSCTLYLFSKAEELKNASNAALKSGNNEEAIKHYSEAIKLDPSNHVLYSNRAAVYAKLERYEESLEDAKKCVEVKPDWAKVFRTESIKVGIN